MIEEGKVNVIIGGQWGSEGKGKLAGYLYANYPAIKVAVSDFTPNTGHTFVNNEGRAYVSKILPIGAVFESVDCVIIGPHAVINVERFKEECNAFRHSGENAVIYIHPLASVLDTRHVADEVRTLNHIASTMQGGAAAQVDKMARDSGPGTARFAKDDPFLKHMVTDTHALIQDKLDAGYTVLIETGQGFDLGLNHGWEWPYVTSRDCMVGRSLDSAGVSPKQVGSIIAALRTYPIRVGNVPGGWSGPCHDDQSELTWEELSEKIDRPVKEYTTVTKRVRRVFSWSNEQVDRFCQIIRPDFAFLNFVNYLTYSERGEFIKQVESVLFARKCKLSLLGTGAKLSDALRMW